MSSPKQEALRDIVEIAKRHQITGKEISQALNNLEKQSHHTLLKLTLTYIGGLLIFLGIAVYVGMFWDQMNSATRILATLGIGFVAYILGVIALYDPRYEKASSPLILTSAAIQPTGIFVLFSETFYGFGGHIDGLIVFLLMFIQQFCTFLAKRKTLLLFTSIAFATLFIVEFFDFVRLNETYNITLVGLLLFIAAIFVQHSPYYRIASLGYFFGGSFMMVGLYELLHKEGYWFYLYLIPAFALVYISTLLRSAVILFVGGISAFAFTCYITKKYFVDSIGWPLSLVMLGIILLLISSYAFRLKQQFK